ncbi:MAG: M1 family metallopeptidase [Acidobacteriota bacterium]
MRRPDPIATLLWSALALLGGCSGPGTPPSAAAGQVAPAPETARRRDVHSYARPDQVRVVHLDLDWDVRFERKVLDGGVVLHLERDPEAAAEPLRLDTRDLEILQVEAGTGEGKMAETPWRLGRPDPILGSELIVDLPDATTDRVRIRYRTRPGSTGLQWLDKEQTASKQHPFLYTQSEAINARSWIPCQDSPAVRVTYNARVHAPPPLRAVMAAEHLADGPGEFTFRMTHPIAPYLVALAVGDLAFGEIGPRTGIWAEPSVLDKAVYEFADMGRMLEAVERIYGPYRWGRYDLLVLPPAFPLGGMENPMLTFATPTVLAGDRSLVSLVAHEMAHSWSGNLVTNATWSDFWLNEGFTTYLERRIMEEVYGPDRAEMEWALGRQDLDKEIASMADKPGDQVLEIDLAGRDPDDGFTDVPYEKGALLLRLLEKTYGRDVFDAFLRDWFDDHAFTSVTTDDLRAFLREHLIGHATPAKTASAPDIEAWLTGPGVPADAPVARSRQFAIVDEAAARWSAGKVAAKDLDTGGWTTHEWQRFIRALPEDLTAERMRELDEAFGLTRTGNAEILDEWLVLAVKHAYEPAYGRMEEFLTSQGRRKFLTPLYRAMTKTKEGAAMARRIYEKARPMYHAMSRRTLDPIVGWDRTAGAVPAASGAAR